MGKMAPMNEALAENYGERPRQHLADGGYTKFDDIEALEKAQTHLSFDNLLVLRHRR
jgi:hypothetical protein